MPPADARGRRGDAGLAHLRRLALRLSKRTGLIARVSPGRVSQQRRHEWPSRDAVLAHYAAKAVFARWDPRVLKDYVDTGFHAGVDGRIHLGFDRAIETRIYDSLPDHLAGLLRRAPPRCPVGFIAGTDSAELRQGGVARVRALAGARFTPIEGTHLYPMERPDETAAQVLRLLATMR